MELCHRLYRGMEPIHIGAIFIGLTIKVFWYNGCFVCHAIYSSGVPFVNAIASVAHVFILAYQIPCDADGRSVYRFRYTETPVFLFVSHEAVEAYSFFAVSVDIPVIHIAVGPLCNDIVLELLNSALLW